MKSNTCGDTCAQPKSRFVARRFCVSLVAAVLVAFPSAFSFAHIWTDPQGKVLCEGNILLADGNSVDILRPDGEIKSIHLNALSEEDRQYVRRQTQPTDFRSVPMASATMLAGVEASAEAEWRRATVCVQSGQQAVALGKPVLVLSVKLRGPTVAKASGFADATLETIQVGKERQLRAAWRGTRGWMTSLTRVGSAPDKNHVKLEFVIEDAPAIRTIQRLKGNVVLRVGGRFDTVILGDLLTGAGKVRDDDSLKRLGIDVLVRWSRPSQIEVKLREDRNPVMQLEITDRDGVSLAEASWSVNQLDIHGNRRCFTFSYAKPVPEGAELRLTTHRDSELFRVPFVVTQTKVADYSNATPSLEGLKPSVCPGPAGAKQDE